MIPDYAQLIGSVGFPIVAFMLVYFNSNKVILALKSSIENNTKATQELSRVVHWYFKK